MGQPVWLQIKLRQLSERLVSIDIKGAQLRDPLKSFEHHRTMVSRGFSGALNWALIMTKAADISNSRGSCFQPWFCNTFYVRLQNYKTKLFLMAIYQKSSDTLDNFPFHKSVDTRGGIYDTNIINFRIVWRTFRSKILWTKVFMMTLYKKRYYLWRHSAIEGR